MRPLTSSDLDRQVIIQQRTVTRDPTLGSELVAWSTLATVWAQVIPSATATASDEAMRQGVQTYARPTKVRMRHRTDVDTTMRLSHNGHLLQILGLAELGRKQGLELACKEWSHE